MIWAIAGGVPKSLSLLDTAEAARAATSDFTFLQISDSHVGFDKKRNTTALATLTEAVARIKAMVVKASFLIHTGDITHLSKASQFDDAEQIIGSTGITTHYVPGEYDIVDAGLGKAYMERHGKGTHGQGRYSFDQNGVHFVNLVNVVNLQAGGLGNLGAEQLAWLRKDLAGQGDGRGWRHSHLRQRGRHDPLGGRERWRLPLRRPRHPRQGPLQLCPCRQLRLFLRSAPVHEG